METINAFFGQHDLDVWGAGLIWTFVGIIAIKLYYLIKAGVTLGTFSFKYWLNENLFDVIGGVIVALLVLRGGDALVHWGIEKMNWTIPDTKDFVIVMIPLSALIQIALHKVRKPVSKQIEVERHMHNENCGHLNTNNK